MEQKSEGEWDMENAEHALMMPETRSVGALLALVKKR